MQEKNKKNTEISARILQILENQEITPNLFAKKLGYYRSQTVYDIINRKSAPSYDFFKRFEISEYSEIINISWLLTGNGTMLRNRTVQNSQNAHLPSTSQETELQGKYNEMQEKNKKNTEKKLIPFYDLNAEAGTMEISDMSPVAQPDEWIDAGDWFRDADTAMRVHGDSMFPVYKSGSIVVMREVKDKTLIIYGQDYVLETSEYRVIKRLQKSKDKECWLACSVNDEIWEKGDLAGRLIHEPFDVHINNVYRLFRILGCVNRTESSRIIHANHKTNY